MAAEIREGVANVRIGDKAPEIRKFTCNVPQQKIDRLHKRLDEVEFPTELEDGPGWDYGSPMYSVVS
jgi:hypothetical protein